MEYYPLPDQNTYAQSTWLAPPNVGFQHGSLHTVPTLGTTAYVDVDKVAAEQMIALATGTLLKQHMQQRRRNMIEHRIRKVVRSCRVKLAGNAESEIQTFLLKALRIGLHGIPYLAPSSKTSSLGTWKQQCPKNVGIMDLPVEVRLHIYRYLWKDRKKPLISHPDLGCQVRDDETGLANAWAYENMILEVNKQICAEAASIFFNENELTLWLSIGIWSGKIVWRQDLMTDIQKMYSESHLFHHVRKINLNLRFNGEMEDHDSFYWEKDSPEPVSLPCRSDRLSKSTANDLQTLVTDLLTQLPNLKHLATYWKDCACWGALWKAEIEPHDTQQVGVHISRRSQGIHYMDYVRVSKQEWQHCVGNTRKRLIREVLAPLGGLGVHVKQEIKVKIGPYRLQEGPLYAEFTDALADIVRDAEARRQEERLEAFKFITEASGVRWARLAGGHLIVKLKYKA